MKFTTIFKISNTSEMLIIPYLFIHYNSIGRANFKFYRTIRDNKMSHTQAHKGQGLLSLRGSKKHYKL